MAQIRVLLTGVCYTCTMLFWRKLVNEQRELYSITIGVVIKINSAAVEIMVTFSHQGWRVPPEDIQLAHDEVHVWRVSLQVPPAIVQSLRACLSEEELFKAGHFYFDRDRNRYIVARGL